MHVTGVELDPEMAAVSGQRLDVVERGDVCDLLAHGVLTAAPTIALSWLTCSSTLSTPGRHSVSSPPGSDMRVSLWPVCRT